MVSHECLLICQFLNVFQHFTLSQFFFSIVQYLGYILIIYASTRIITIIIASIRADAKDYFKTGLGRDEIEHQKGERSNNLSLAGFSSATLALFLTLGGVNRSDINDTTFYLSISLSCFVIAAYLSLVWSHRYWSFITESIEILGVLSVILAILLFFIHNTTHFPNIQNVYAILFVAIIIILGKGIWRDLIFALKYKKPRVKSTYLGAFQDKKATDGSGLFAFLTGASIQTSSSSYNLSKGRAIRITSEKKSGAHAGARSNSTVTMRKFNPYFKMTFSLEQITNQRFWIGWTGNTNSDPTGDTEMDGKNCFCLGARSTDTNFMIVSNNGSALSFVV